MRSKNFRTDTKIQLHRIKYLASIVAHVSSHVPSYVFEEQVEINAVLTNVKRFHSKVQSEIFDLFRCYYFGNYAPILKIL